MVYSASMVPCGGIRGCLPTMCIMIGAVQDRTCRHTPSVSACGGDSSLPEGAEGLALNRKSRCKAFALQRLFYFISLYAYFASQETGDGSLSSADRKPSPVSRYFMSLYAQLAQSPLQPRQRPCFFRRRSQRMLPTIQAARRATRSQSFQLIAPAPGADRRSAPRSRPQRSGRRPGLRP